MKYTLGLLLTIMTIAAQAAPPIQISPSGDTTGYTDQVNIQAAFDAAGSNKKTKIRLKRGTFYLNGGVHANGFRGTLSGTGRSNSKVVALGSGDPANRGSVFLFIDGNATIKNLSIEVPEGSSYLDSNPSLGVSDGGAAIDIFGGSATIKNVDVLSNGPFGPFGQESLETGILLQNCDADFELKESTFMGVKRSFVFNPTDPSQCALKLTGNDFHNNRGGIFLLGSATGGNTGLANVSENIFSDTLTTPIFYGMGVDYPVTISDNEITESMNGGNAAIQVFDGVALLNISENTIIGEYEGSSILIEKKSGGTTITENEIEGASFTNSGAIAIVQSDDVIISENDFTENQSIPGWVLPNFTSGGAYAVVLSTNVTIENELHTAANLAECQVAHLPAIDPSNQIDAELIECVSGF